MKNIFIPLLILISIFSRSQDLTFENFSFGYGMALTELGHAGDDRIFGLNKEGTIEIIQQNGEMNTESFLDITHLVSYNSNFSEEGLLGLAFHPEYQTNGLFFVFYTDHAYNRVIARYQVSENPDIANPDGNIILTIPPTNSELHFGGKIAFDHNGYLWIASGTGSSGLHAMNLENLWGKILRIDINAETYTIPPDNPFIGVEGVREEIWAYGLRNPWKFSFDFEANEVWIADVGDQNEEINRQPIDLGGIHYGFPCYSGDESYNFEPCENIDPETFTFPYFQYEFPDGQAVIGGYVYRQNQDSPLYGNYIFGDYFGTIGILDNESDATFITDVPYINQIYSFGEDVHKQLYLSTFNRIFKILDNAMSTDELDETSFSLYPNPTSNFINISANKVIDEVSIYSAEGKLLQTFNGNITQIDISHYPKGVYLLGIQSGKITKTQKVVKK